MKMTPLEIVHTLKARLDLYATNFVATRPEDKARLPECADLIVEAAQALREATPSGK